MISMTSRRALIGAIGLALPAAAVAIGSSTAAAPVDTSAWDQAMAVYLRAKAEQDAAEEAYNPVWEAWCEACKAIPHSTFEPDPYGGITEPLTTSDRRHVRYVEISLHGVRRVDPWPSLQAHYDLVSRFKAAHDSREAEKRRLSEQMGLPALVDRTNAASDVLSDAEDTLMSMPAPTLAAAKWKLELLFEGVDKGRDMPGWSSSYAAPVLADVRRLVGEA